MAELDPTILIVSCCFRLCSGFHRTFLDLFGFCLRLGTEVQVVFAVEVPHWVTKRTGVSLVALTCSTDCHFIGNHEPKPRSVIEKPIGSRL